MSELEGKRVLLVEDEAIIALSLEDLLSDLGCRVVGPALNIDDAVSLALGEAFDAAVLDINMGDGTSYRIARTLTDRSIPFCFATGYGDTGVHPDFAGVPVLQKPYRQDALADVLRRMFRSQA